jgi:uncharacterized membrane protein
VAAVVVQPEALISVMGIFRRYLIAGLLVWVPLGVTLLIIKFLVDLMDQTLLLLPRHVRPEALIGQSIPGLGLVLTLIVVWVTGVVVTNLFGRRLYRLGELILSRIPFVRSVYSAVKQVTETLFSGTGKSFRKVCLVEYPRHGLWSLAFMTGVGAPEIKDRTGRDVANIFIPTTPNPTSGFFLMVPRDEVIELTMSVDDGLKMLISVGVVMPGAKKAELTKRYANAS